MHSRRGVSLGPQSVAVEYNAILYKCIVFNNVFCLYTKQSTVTIYDIIYII